MDQYRERVHPITIDQNKRRIAIIGTVGIPPRYGGFETFVEQLTAHLSKDFKFLVFCSKYSYDSRNKKYHDITRVFLPFKANGYQSVVYDIISIIYSLLKADALLILGISGCVALPFIKIFTKKKIIVSVDGLDPEREKWPWIVGRFLKLSEWCAVRYSDTIISDNKGIHEYLLDKYKKDSKLIEYGAEHSKYIKPTNKDMDQYPFLSYDYALAIARIEKENHCEMILESFSNNSNINLIFVGTWSGNKYGKRLYEKYYTNKNIILLNPIYDLNKINLIRSNAFLFVHGNGAGGTNPGLLEAMKVGLPIIAYDVNFNREVTRNNALFFTDAIQISKHVEKYLLNEKFKNRFGIAVKEIANTNYGWISIAEEYKELFLE